METYPWVDEGTGRVAGFEIDNLYLSLSTLIDVLSAVDGVTDIRRRRPFSKWVEIHVWFRFNGTDCVVWEPHGDSSSYWIGQADSPQIVDVGAIERAFGKYRPPLHRRLIGDVASLRFLKREPRSGVRMRGDVPSDKS